MPDPEASVELIEVPAGRKFPLGWQDKVLSVEYFPEPDVYLLTILRRVQ